MNKGVIVQLDDKIAYILKNDGGFVSYPRDMRWQVGDVVTLSQYPRLNVKAALIAAVLCISLLFVTGFVIYQIPTTYIEVSVNPSVQFTVNRFNRVLKAVGLNDDGKSLIQDVSYNNLTLDEAYARLLNRMKNNGYLQNSFVQLIIANDSQKGLDNTEQILRQITDKNITQSDKTIMSIKRYANDEYLALPHPLPIVDIPIQDDAEETTPTDDDNAQPPTEIPDTPKENSTPQVPTEPPSISPATPTPNLPRHGNWQNGWWDWDCGWGR